ncbi:DNA phosphorothioation system sulfurtransferase DndC [Massilia sp. MB5]|uniref:DNA phosphorothioation system sulfurtransferase DndC n=1 Tax=Massilia sp. MB5 TaxID=2919578 RepID=UPI001F0E517B|nr:DNA phosphorothioation system sulfurtransferase DndC [Massilia sp. MB5]UMR29719.1 DNA phosphorothioation system sulfurtransferase DndC [Massilia sp. MB5]
MESLNLADRVALAIKNTQELYLSDPLPWIVGYSGGKDSTATLQLIWESIRQLPPHQRHKEIHVISTDTLVENPVVAIWVTNSLEAMTAAAREQEMPITPHRLVPKVEDRFWTNLIGKGYPAPRPKFRWCTSRLKISASNTFITELANRAGEAILVLGTRRAESAARDRVISKYENSTRALLSRNSDPTLDRVWVYTPVASWSTDDVWEYLIETPNPWNYNNLELFHIYRGASADSECPLVVDKSTPSCGDSRFGCFVCTMVSEDKSMQAMIQNDEDKLWMKPLLDFRNALLKTSGDREVREFSKMDGSLQLQFINLKHDRVVRRGRVLSERLIKRLDHADDLEFPLPNRRVLVQEIRVVDEHGKQTQVEYEVEKVAVLVHGPYTQAYRAEMLNALLQAQTEIRGKLPDSVAHFSVISDEELEEIRRIWVHEKHEFEDLVPDIYASAVGEPYPCGELDDATPLRPDDLRMLRTACANAEIDAKHIGPVSAQEMLFRDLRELLGIQYSYRGASRRVGLTGDLDSILENRSFENESEALDFALQKKAGGVEIMYEMRNAEEVLTFFPGAAMGEVTE